MCKQKEVIDKIRKAGKLDGFFMELSEAQMQDHEKMTKRMSRMEKDISHMKKDFAASLKEQARQGGIIEAIFKRINSPVEEERKNGIIWSEIKSIMKTPTGKVIMILAIGCIGLAGEKIIELLRLI